MTEIGLTQEQIDAMLGGGAPDGGSVSDDMAALADFERETMGNLPSVLNAMTGSDYVLDSVEFSPTNPEELAALAGDDLVFSIPIDVDQPLTHLLLLEAGFSKEVAAALTGGDPLADVMLSEMEQSAIQEVVSQANGTYLTNLGAALKIPASGEALSLVNISDAIGLVDDRTLIGVLTISRSDGSTSQVRHLIPGELAELILAAVHKDSAPAPAAAQSPPTAAPPPPSAAVPPTERLAMDQTAVPAVSSGHIMGPATEFQPASFGQLSVSTETIDTRNLDILLDVPLEVTVELGKTRIPIRHILEYCQGSLITLDKLAGEPIDLLVNGKYFAKGEVVVIDESFGVRITSILTPAERIAQLT